MLRCCSRLLIAFGFFFSPPVPFAVIIHKLEYLILNQTPTACRATGIEPIHVPYCGGAPALTDLIAGQVQFMFISVPSSIANIRAGKLRPLALTTTTRSDALPDIPTVSEFVLGYEASAWFGISVPTGTHDRDTHEERQTVWMHLEVEELASPSVRDVSVPITVPVKRNRFGRLYDVPMFSGFLWSEWQDLNLRPPRPERGALPSRLGRWLPLC